MTFRSARSAFDVGQPEPLLWTLALAASIASFQTASAAVVGSAAATLLAVALVVPIGVLAGLHRPFGSQGLGALGVPLALATLGSGWGPIAVALGAGLSQGLFDQRYDRVSARRSFGSAARGLLGGTGAFWAAEMARQISPGTRWTSPLFGATAWLLLTTAIDAWLASRSPGPVRQNLPRGLLEAAAWGLGNALRADASACLGLALAAAWAEAGRQAGAAERGEHRVQALLASAATDATTGLTETRAWRRELDRRYRASRAEGSNLAVAVFDLDDLGSTNARGGFASGDERLRDLSLRLPPGADSGRWHGGAAICALSASSGQEALATAERLRASFDGDPRGTLSCGLASTAELATHDAEDLLALAEGALRRAKQEGGARALLDLGGGRFGDPTGGVVDSEAGDEERAAPTAPPFFA